MDDITNFPKQGMNERVLLRNSNSPLFDLDFAERIKVEYPHIWKLGGNIRGNDAYMLGYRHRTESSLVTPAIEAWIREREAWIARHFRDFRIAGVIAQIKWHAIGSRGENYMKNLVNEEIRRRNMSARKETGYDTGSFDFLKFLG